jgi:uncharacterized BrkB/YihY/UPF0761 family membrane protein
MNAPRTPLGVKLLAAFFAFGAGMCLLTIILLLVPGRAADAVWRINPEAQHNFSAIGAWAFILMAVVGLACAFAAAGLATRKPWGRTLAITVLSINLLGDTTNAVLRQDYRTLIGLPIAGAILAYLFSANVRRIFAR